MASKSAEYVQAETPENTIQKLRLFADYRPFHGIRFSLNRAADLLEQHYVAKDAVRDNAYTLSAECPSCGQLLNRGYEEKFAYCHNCGQRIHFRAFTDEEIKDAHLQDTLDGYEES